MTRFGEAVCAVVLATKLCLNKFYDMVPEGSKANPVGEGPGGGGVVAGLCLQKLGVQVELLGRYATTDQGFRDHAVAHGIRCRMTCVDGIGAVNAVLPGARILRVVKGPRYDPTPEEGRYLARCDARAIAATGSLEDRYVAFLAETSAALGIPFFWNAACTSDLSAADCGAELYLQASAGEFGAAGQPKSLAAELILRSGAAAVIVTDSERDAHGLERGMSNQLCAPAIRVSDPVREVGAGDAHFAGVIAAFLNCRRAIRLERALAIGRLVAARHVSGIAAGGWSDLRCVENQALVVPAIVAA